MSHAQSRLASLVEALVGVVIGFGINFLANMLILPLYFGTTISLTDNFAVGMIFTVISVVRSYAIRRWFATGLHNLINRLFPA